MALLIEHMPADGGQPTEDPQHTKEHRAYTSQHRKQRGDFGRHVGANA
jgi:hypothetical protein